jgi:carboxypeptidase C (cathepsin A)
MPRLPLRSRFLAAAIVGLLSWSVAGAQTPHPPGPTRPPDAKTQAEQPAEVARPSEPALPADAVTGHLLSLKGRQIAYTARAGTLTLTDAEGGKTAEVFYVAYTLDGKGAAARPITFAFNGGPGASSAYLQLGAIGPRVLDFGDGRSPVTPGGKIVDNPDTWLAFSDLVFIDPVGTGYSRATNAVKDVGKAFWGVHQDLDALDKIIWLALAKLDRFASPVYLAGESYGGYRAARLIARLPDDQGVAVSGATLISPALEFSLSGGDDLNPLPWALRLPSYAAVALEGRGKLSPEALAGVERFALGDYLAALAAPLAEPDKNAALYATIADDIGLPEALVARWRGRVPARVFTKEIHHDQGEVASLYDGSVVGIDSHPSAPESHGPDPVFESIIAPLTTAFVAYARDELQFKTERPYVLVSSEVNHKWDWERRGPSGSVGASDDLRRALATNPRLKVVIDHGMTDLVTPYMASRFVIDHLPGPLTQGRVALHLYAGGHMMYLRPESRAELAATAQAMYAKNN